MDTRILLPKNYKLGPCNKPSISYIIDGIISIEGSSAIVYSGRDQEGHNVVLKEFYPIEHSIGRQIDGSLDYDKRKYLDDIEQFERQADINNRLLRLDNGTYSVYFSEMKIVHANEIVREVFEVTGFSDIMTVE